MLHAAGVLLLDLPMQQPEREGIDMPFPNRGFATLLSIWRTTKKQAGYRTNLLHISPYS